MEFNQIHVMKAILFGSYANGTFNEWSDIDLLIVSDSFKGNRFEGRNIIRIKEISKVTKLFKGEINIFLLFLQNLTENL